MCFGAFLLGLLAALLLVGYGVHWLRARRRKAGGRDRPSAVKFAVEEIIDELGEESDAYLDELTQMLSK